jgi:hypothetical protein
MKKPSDEERKPTSDISGRQFPWLRAFMRSYLHQDFGEEYGSVEEAVRTFCDDASEAEASAVLDEWRVFLDSTRGKPLGEINNLLASKLGSAWNAGSLEELNLITETLERCGGGRGE